MAISSSIVWFCYGIKHKDNFIAIPEIVNLLIYTI